LRRRCDYAEDGKGRDSGAGNEDAIGVELRSGRGGAAWTPCVEEPEKVIGWTATRFEVSPSVYARAGSRDRRVSGAKGTICVGLKRHH